MYFNRKIWDFLTLKKNFYNSLHTTHIAACFWSLRHTSEEGQEQVLRLKVWASASLLKLQILILKYSGVLVLSYMYCVRNASTLFAASRFWWFCFEHDYAAKHCIACIDKWTTPLILFFHITCWNFDRSMVHSNVY